MRLSQGVLARRRAGGLPAVLLAENAAEERDFPATTDRDRLTAVFARLDADGIVTREDAPEVAAALADAGLNVDWNGDPNRRIELVEGRWQRRRRSPRRGRPTS